ncbi:MAG TPA: ABC transporter substrate-binding protein [Thermomicrobiales bacterium]
MSNADRRSTRPGSLCRCQSAGTLSRRAVLGRAAALGLGGAALATARAVAAPATARRRATHTRWQGDATTLTIASFGSASDLDPHSAYDYRSTMAILGAYEGLIGLKDDKTEEYEPLIAESWEANADKSVWTFHIRPGVTFQDGTPCDAEAVRASFERFITMGLGPVNVITRFVEDPAQITVPNPGTVVFDLGRPQPFFEAALASTYGPLIVNTKRLKELESDGDFGHAYAETNAEGLGTGPYRIVEFEPGDILVMERNESYWRGWDGNHFERIVIRTVPEDATRRQLIERGEADIVDNLVPEAIAALRGNPDVVIHQNTSTQIQYYIFTIADPLTDPRARQGLCYAFPYDDVINGAYGGLGKRAIGAVPEVLRGFAPDTFTYTTDLAKAKELLAAAGITEGTKLSCALEVGDEKVNATTQLFQANLAQIGITLEIELMQTNSYMQLLYGEAPPEERPNLLWWGWWPDYNDAWNHLYPQISCDAQGSQGSNAGFYCNQRVEELLAQAKDAAMIEEYEQAVAEIQQIISRDDPPALYYIQPLWTTVLRADIQGFFFNPINVGTFNFWKLSRATS